MEIDDLTPTERHIAENWRGILAITEVLPNQSFFELGGDSLLMVDMLFQLNKELDLEIDPSLLFEDATLRGFARLIDITYASEGPLEEGTL